MSKTNHDAIVSDADFWYAFDRLSPITIEGETNHLMEVPPARYTHDGTPPLEALLDGIVTGGALPVYVMRTFDPPRYAIAEVDSLHGSHYKQSIGVAVLDTIFVTRLLHVIDHTEHGATLQDHLVGVRSARTSNSPASMSRSRKPSSRSRNGSGASGSRRRRATRPGSGRRSGNSRASTRSSERWR